MAGVEVVQLHVAGPALAPAAQSEDHVLQLATGLGQRVLVTPTDARPLLVQDARALERAEARREHRGRDARQGTLQVAEAADAVHQCE